MNKQIADLSSQAQNLTGLIDVQSASVVSRPIHSKKAGNLTLFAFDSDQGLSEHSAPFDAFVISLEGQLLVTISGQPHELNAGEIILLPANKAHALHAESPAKMLLIMIRE